MAGWNAERGVLERNIWNINVEVYVIFPLWFYCIIRVSRIFVKYYLHEFSSLCNWTDIQKESILWLFQIVILLGSTQHYLERVTGFEPAGPIRLWLGRTALYHWATLSFLYFTLYILFCQVLFFIFFIFHWFLACRISLIFVFVKFWWYEFYYFLCYIFEVFGIILCYWNIWYYG